MIDALIVAAIVSQNNPTTELLEPQKTETVQVEKKPTLYTIKQGDNLTKIADAHSVDLKRLWAANPELANPDVIKPGDVIVVPQSDEVLPEREMPVTVVNTVPLKARTSQPSRGSSNVRSGRSTPGWYYAGQCTAWVANKRYVPDGWGNASDWRWHAQAEGWTVSGVPVAGAIGWTSGHVVYVESVNGDGTVTISEQNYDWHGSIRTITVPVAKYVYLY